MSSTSSVRTVNGEAVDEPDKGNMLGIQLPKTPVVVSVDKGGRSLTNASDRSLSERHNGLRSLNITLCKALSKVFQASLRVPSEFRAPA